MSFKAFPEQQQGVGLLQRSLEQGRLAHAYLFSGEQLGNLEALAQTLAKTLNCQNPVRKAGVALDCCDHCLSCQKIESGNHADVFWVRPESKMRVIRMNQVTRRNESPPRVLIEFVNLKPTEGEYKVAIIAAADRMNEQAANAFLKTLEEPPAKSILILLTTEPQRILETIVSRCARINFGGNWTPALDPAQMEWLGRFSELASAEQRSLLGRYRLMDVMLKRLTELRAAIDESLTAQSPMQRHKEAEKNLQEQWEDELKAAVEAEYRRQRSDLLALVQAWLRDVWLLSRTTKDRTGVKDLLMFPKVAGSERIAGRISPAQAQENLQVIEQLQRWLFTNVQEALALEVGFLKLHL
jgi:DNA polymerase III subunit delta'